MRRWPLTTTPTTRRPKWSTASGLIRVRCKPRRFDCRGDVGDALKALAQARGMRCTALVREIIEHAVNGVRLAESEEFARIDERLTRIEAAVVAQSEEPPGKRPARKNPTSGSKTKVSAAHGRTSRVAAAPASTAKASVGARRRAAGKG